MFTSTFRICLIFTASLVGFGSTQIHAAGIAVPIQTESDEEAFLIRRIAEFWKDGDFRIVKMQIVDFLDKYPESSLKDYFLGILGDIYLQEDRYAQALDNYQQIQDPYVIKKTLLNKLQCHYELDQYEELTEDARPYLLSHAPEIQDRKDELYFLMGEALFRQALKEEESQYKFDLAQEALGYYENLPSQQYKEIASFAVAEICAMLGQHEKAAHSYKELAENHPEMKEDLLFQVGSLEAHFNKLGAVETFRRVQELDGKRADEAAFNVLVLLYQTEEYEEVISSYEKISQRIPEKHLPTFHFIVGKSFFSVGNYKNAINPLKEYIASTYLPSDELKNALLIQMTCAHQTSDEALFSTSFEKLNALFPKDQEIPKALFMHAMILKEQGAIAEADEKLRIIKEEYQDFEDQESFLFEYGLLAHQNERWEESYDTFKAYIAQYDESSRVDAAWKLFLSSSINLYKEEREDYPKPLFFADLEKVLAYSAFLSSDEMKDYALLYAKTAYELDHYSKALHCLQDHIFTVLEDGEKTDTLAEAHFIAGLCHAETGSDPSAFCMHLEEAMLLKPDLYDSPPTHLQLFNAYISLAGYGESREVPATGEQQKEFINHAAEHLQEAISKGADIVKEENLLWLANHYYEKVTETDASLQKELHPEVANAADHARTHYEHVLFSNNQLVGLKADNLHLENEVVKLAKLYEYQNEHQEKLTLIKQLLQQQSEKPELNWSSQKEVLYELATVYDALGDKEKAFETYSFIHASANHFPAPLANQATLAAARLQFELLEDDLRKESNEEVLAVLNHLKELQIRKNVSCEPTHLEAALEYAKIRAILSDPKERDSRYLFFLNRIKDDFNSQEDLVTQDYLVTLSRDAEKKHLFESYMKFIDAEKTRLEAKKLYEQNRLVEMEELHEGALSLYSKIKNDPSTPRDLYGRIAISVQEINALNAYP